MSPHAATGRTAQRLTRARSRTVNEWCGGAMQTLRRRSPAARGSFGEPAAAAQPQRPSGLRSWLYFPVIFDFVWQDTASPTVTYAVVLKLVKCVIVILTQASDYIKKSLKKSKAKGKGAAQAKAAVQDKALMLEKCVRSMFCPA